VAFDWCCALRHTRMVDATSGTIESLCRLPLSVSEFDGDPLDHPLHKRPRQ
jgi:hypothetical protein